MSNGSTADTSIVVPALVGWHEQHQRARAATVHVERLPSHVMVEAYSVLTRLPKGLALAPRAAAGLLRDAFPAPPLVLDAEDYPTLLSRLAVAGVPGGAVYDGLVGWTAARHGLRLITRDERAQETYRAVGVEYRLVG